MVGKRMAQAPAITFHETTALDFAAWNAAVYVAQIDDERLAEQLGARRYLDATREVLQAHGQLWFLDESYVISKKRG